ncbi:hypothetical protein [Halorhabdus rudnickae]|uniref:hypothetical protein n=1 Tax=Halorhabdus rudnickae TaxID=1775544 RepID=UPI001083E5E6|nr:hypothetical protein [Halorhabdus rudnickae]
MTEVEALETRVEELESRVNELEQLIHDGQGTDEVTGLREFVNQINPSTHVERALAIGYYLEQYQGQENFTRADLEEEYRTCRVQKPANMSDVLANLREKEWAMPDGEKGQSKPHRLTADGLTQIEEGLSDGA